MKNWALLAMRTAVFSGVAASAAFASFARVESMGKSADFFMDDVSIFDNPANMNIFPNFLIGELGTFPGVTVPDTGANPPLGGNRDPDNSWFGGIFSYSLAKNKERSAPYPQISIGGAFNRMDDEILPYVPDSIDGKVIPKPATNFDGFLGMALANGGMLGSHIYVAMQDGANLVNGRIVGTPSQDIRLSLLRADLGMNWPLGKSVDGELSLGTALTSYGPDSVDGKWSFFVKARSFSTVELINGELVPIFRYSRIEMPGEDLNLLHFGLGANVSLDRGFFWLGVEGLFDTWNLSGIDSVNGTSYSTTSTVHSRRSQRGVSVGFGIERNIWWDWLVLRVGGRKVIAYTEDSGPSGSYNYIYTNPTGDMTVDDEIGFGIGLNVEEKLKVDATLAEDLPYTFGNLLSGPRSNIISRISATYSF